MEIKPLGARILIETETAKERTASGLYVPQSAQEKTQIGKVVAIGEGTKDVKIDLEVGQNVMYDKYAGTSFKDGDKDYLILKYEDVIAIIN